MSLGYQRSDAQIIDYELYALPSCEGWFRGPAPVGGEYIACLGAAQTFGRFVLRPYPKLLSERLGVDPLNLGRGGAGPGYSLRESALMEHVNRARLVVVQCFSGRSQSNSLFQTHRDNIRGVNLRTGLEATADEFYTWLLGQDTALAQRVVAETRDNYVSTMTRLLEAIAPPKVLLWFSTRVPDYSEQWHFPLSRLYGEFPQLVNRAMIDQLRAKSDTYVECVSRQVPPPPFALVQLYPAERRRP